MAYRRSRARNTLEERYESISSTLLVMERSNPDSSVREFVIAAAIFLAHAEVENYISDVLSSFASAACAKVTRGSELPENLRAHLFIQKSNMRSAFGALLAGGPEDALLRAFSHALKNAAGSIVNDAVPVTQFTGADIFSLHKYPSKDNLKKVFVRLGITNIFDRLSNQLKQDAAGILDSLGALRSALAHTGTLPGTSVKDVRDRLHQTKKFVGAVDRVLFKEVAGIYGSKTWRTYIASAAVIAS